MTDAVFELQPGLEPHTLMDGLRALLPCQVAPPRTERLVVLDTFDGRLVRERGTLYLATGEHGSRLCLSLPDAAETREFAQDTVPAFASDLHGTPCHALGGIVAMRRLLPILEVERSEQALDVLDDERKTTVRLTLTEGIARRRLLPGETDAPGVVGTASSTLASPLPPLPPLPALLVVSPVRGYESALESLLPVLSSRPGLRPSLSGPREQLLDLVAAVLPSRPPALGEGLDPDLPAAQAMQRIHRALLAAIRLHEVGARLDVDSEFLHDLRVAVRRTRCLLGQLKRIFPADAVLHWRHELSWLGRLTGPLRDLDVFLLALADPGLVSVEERAALAPLVEHVESLRRDEHARFVAQLGSPRHTELLAGWEAFLGPVDAAVPADATGPAPAAPAAPTAAAGADRADRGIARLVSKRVARLYRRIVKRGAALGPHAADQEFHTLRIEAKKMRYLLDATRPVLDAEKSRRLIASLKRLQAVLGELQDAHVQRRLLAEAISSLAELSPAPPTATLLAVGRLDERLRGRAERARDGVAERLAAFAEGELRATVRQLCESATARGAAQGQRDHRPARSGRGARRSHPAHANGRAPARPADRQEPLGGRPVRQPRKPPAGPAP